MALRLVWQTAAWPLALVAIAALSATCQEGGPPSVAVLIRPAEKAGPEVEKVARDFSALVEASFSAEGGVQLVERAKLDAALKELALVPGASAERLGQITLAKVLLLGTLTKREGSHLVEARVVDALSGKVLARFQRSGTVKEWPVMAAESARLTRRAALSEQPAKVTVAVLNFTYEGIFDKLAPLQQRVKALLVDRLLRCPQVWVLERENMKGLVEEMEWAARGPVDEKDLPSLLPPREGTYIATGSYSDVTGRPEPWVKVRLTLVKADTQTKVLQVEKETSLAALPKLCDTLAERVLDKALGDAPRGGVQEDREAAFRRHFQAAMAAVRRLDRLRLDWMPELPQPYGAYQIGPADGELCGALLRRAANDLECALYFRPDHRPAKLLLAEVYSQRDAWDMDRALRLLDEVEDSDRAGIFGLAARRYRVRTYAEAEYAETSRNRSFWKAQWINALERQFRDTPDELREYFEMYALADAGLYSGFVLDDHARSMALCEEVLRYIVAHPPFQNGKCDGPLDLATGQLFCAAHRLGKFSEACRIARDVIAAMPPYAAVRIHLRMGDACRKAKELSEALRAYEAASQVCAIQTGPQFTANAPIAKRSRGEVLCLMEREPEGIPLLEEVFRECMTQQGGPGGELLSTALSLGEVHEKRGREKDALALYQSVYNRAPHLRKEARLIKRIQDLRARLGARAVAGPRRIEAKLYDHEGMGTISKIVADEAGLWCVADIGQTSGGRLWRFDTRTERWEREEPSPPAWCVLPVPEGLYVGTGGQGLWFRSRTGKEWKKTTEENGLPFNYVSELASVNGRVFVGFRRWDRVAVGALQDDGTVRLLEGCGAKSGTRNSLASAHGFLWVASRNEGLWRFDPKSSQWEHRDEMAGVELEAHSDELWIFPYKPWLVSWIDAENRRQSLFPKGAPVEGILYPLCGIRAGGKVWLGGGSLGSLESAGIYSYDPETKEFISYGPQDGIQVGAAYCVVRMADDLWFGTQDGLLRIRVPDMQPEAAKPEGPAKIGAMEEPKRKADGEVRR